MSNLPNPANNPVSNLPNPPNLKPNPPPQQLMVAARATVARMAVAPRHGNLDMISAVDIAWTGGNPYDTSIAAPAANECYRPIDPDMARKVEDKCVQPSPEARELQVIDTLVAKKPIDTVDEGCISSLEVQWNGWCVLCSQVKSSS